MKTCRRRLATLVGGTAVLALLFAATRAEARVVSEVRVDPTPDGYELSVHFILPIRYQGHSPERPSKVLRVQLGPADFERLNQDEMRHLRERVTLPWDATTGIPLQEILYDGTHPERPRMTFVFTTDVAWEVRGSADLRALIVTVKPSAAAGDAGTHSKTGSPAKTVPKKGRAAGRAPRPDTLTTLLEQAEAAMMKGNYRRAVDLSTKVLRGADGELKRRAQRLLGFAMVQDVQGHAIRKGSGARGPAKKAPKKGSASRAAPSPDALAKLMKQADAAMAEEDYRRAVELATQVLRSATGELQQRAQALLGRAVAQDVQRNAVRMASSARAPAKRPGAGVPAMKVQKQKSVPEAAPSPEALATLMTQADAAMAEGDYRQAAQAYATVLQTADGELKQRAHELLGLAYDRSGEPERAQATYERYLQEFPQGPDADRVRQRLLGVVTARKEPKERLEVAGAPPESGRTPTWKVRYDGGFSQMYVWDELETAGGGARVTRSDLSTDMNLHATWRSDVYDIRSQFAGSHRDALLARRRDEDRLSAASFEMRDKVHRWVSKVGRQSRTSGGVLGRFDGFHASYGLTSTLVLGGVFGYPVETTRETELKTERSFYGFSADFGPFRDRWELSGFFLDQANEGLVDRRAFGGELRYATQRTFVLYFVDYDIFFGEMNATALSGRWTLPTRTTLNGSLEYRRSPALTTNNAIQGQRVRELSELFDRFTGDQLHVLAEDRTGVSKLARLGLAQPLSTHIEIAAEAMLSELEGTIASGGVEAIPGTGNESFYSTQLIFSDVLLPNDVTIIELRFADTMNHKRVTFAANSRLPFGRKLWLSPGLLLEHRDGKGRGEDRLGITPRLRIEYALRKWLRFEAEGSLEWRDQSALGVDEDSQEVFITAGYRLIF